MSPDPVRDVLPAEGPSFHLVERELEVTIHLWFALDIGYEIDLERARTLLSAESGPLARRRRTPESIRYRPAPVRAAIDPSGLMLPLPGVGGEVAPTRMPFADIALFDFGAVSLAFAYPVRATPQSLTKLAAELADPTALHARARAVAAPWIERIRPAVVDFEVSELIEEYIVFQVRSPRVDWLASAPEWVAGLVRLESEALSPAEVTEATRLHLAYTRNDLVVLDWAAGFVADEDCTDTFQVIEFANVQLLEFRHIDDRLDDRLEGAYRLIGPESEVRRRERRWQPSSLWPGRSQAEAVRQVRELEVEAASLFERADNGLKLIGDQYLSRIYKLASTRFHLDGWQHSIQRKLETVGDVYDLLVTQAGGTRMEVLEIIVIVLIATEILLALFRH